MTEDADLLAQVFTAAGGSLFADDGRGDLPAALAIGATAGRRAHRGEDPLATLAAGLAAFLAGAPALAERRFRSLVAASPTAVDDDVRASADSLAHWAFLQRWYLLPGAGGNMMLTDVVPRADVLAEAVAATGRRGSRPDGLSPVARLIDAVPHAVWTSGSVLATSFPSSLLQNADRATTVAAAAQEAVRQVAAAADAAQSPPAGIWALLTASGLADRIGDADQATRLLDAAERTATGLGDDAGLARCLLQRSDRLAAPLSGLARLDLHQQEGAGAGAELSALDATFEATATSDALGSIDQLLDEATARYATAAATRGAGHVALARSGQAFLRNDWHAQRRWADVAVTVFTDHRDAGMTPLALVHRTIADIAIDGEHADLAPLRRAARCVARHGGFATGLGLVLLLGRAGHHWSSRLHEREIALVAHRSAGLLATRIGAPALASQTTCDRAATWHTVGLHGHATTLYREVLAGDVAHLAAGRAPAGVIRNRTLDAALAVLAAAGSSRDLAEIDAAVATTRAAVAAAGLDLDGPAVTAEELTALATAVDERFTAAITGNAVLAAFGLLRVTRAVAEGRRLRAARDPGVNAARVAALAAADRLREPSCWFHRAVVHWVFDDRDAAAAAYDEYLARGGHAAAMRDEAAPLATFGRAGEWALAENKHGNDREAATFFALIGDVTRARAHLDAVVALAGPDWYRHEGRPWNARALEADVLAAEGDLVAADAVYADAIGMWDAADDDLATDESRTAARGDRTGRGVFLRAARNRLRRGDVPGAFELFERSRGESLVDLTRERDAARHQDPETAARWRAWRLSRARLAGLRRLAAAAPDGAVTPAQLDAAESEADALPPPAPVSESAPSPTAAAALLLVPDDTLVLGWAMADDDLLRFRWWRGDLVGDTVPVDVDHLDGDVSRFAGDCRDDTSGESPESTGSSAAGERLAQLLLAPHADLVRSAERVLFLPFGAALTAPLAALPFDGRPLAATTAVTVLPSIRVLTPVPPGADGDQRPPLVVGDPDRMAWSLPGDPPRPFPALNHARLEARAVAALLAGTARCGADATRDAVMGELPTAGVVHLATHGITVDAAPELSAVLLADGGTISAADLIASDLRADLVVLSACRTGAGVPTEGGELLGLGRALLAAGAGAVVLSLWPAKDLPTCLVMTSFAAGLWAGEDSALALAKAQRRVGALGPDGLVDLALDLEDLLENGADPAALHAALVVGAKDPAGPPSMRRAAYWSSFVHLGPGRVVRRA